MRRLTFAVATRSNALAAPSVVRSQSRVMHTLTYAARATAIASASAATAALSRPPRRALVSTSKSPDGKPLYTNEELDEDKFTFSKWVRAPKVAHIVGGTQREKHTERHASGRLHASLATSCEQQMRAGSITRVATELTPLCACCAFSFAPL